MNIPFQKLQAQGNDFIVINCLQQNLNLSADKVRALCQRNFGIGADGILLLCPATDASVDFDYQIFNADGSPSGQCGNGARCLAKFIFDQGLTNKSQIRVKTTTRILQLEKIDENYAVNLGKPLFAAAQIPLSQPLATLRYQNLDFYFVNLGNPHAMAWVSADLEQFDLKSIGKALNQNPLFLEGVNVSLVNIINAEQIQLRTFERGVGETLACGSGACAAVVMGIQQNYLATKVKVQMPGGEVWVKWPNWQAEVQLMGSVVLVYAGQFEITSTLDQSRVK